MSVRAAPILGQEAIVPGYGLGRVTEITRDRFGVTPYVAGYQMLFDPKNVELVRILKGK